MAADVAVKFAIDKQAHFWWGWAIAATTVPVMGWGSIIVATLLGMAKEVWDKQGHGTPDKLDALATAVGGIAGAVIATVLTF